MEAPRPALQLHLQERGVYPIINQLLVENSIHAAAHVVVLLAALRQYTIHVLFANTCSWRTSLGAISLPLAFVLEIEGSIIRLGTICARAGCVL